MRVTSPKQRELAGGSRNALSSPPAGSAPWASPAARLGHCGPIDKGKPRLLVVGPGVGPGVRPGRALAEAHGTQHTAEGCCANPRREAGVKQTRRRGGKEGREEPGTCAPTLGRGAVWDFGCTAGNSRVLQQGGCDHASLEEETKRTSVSQGGNGGV